jgi:hypothetical protein
LVVLIGLLAAYSTVANVKQKSTTTVFLRCGEHDPLGIWRIFSP